MLARHEVKLCALQTSAQNPTGRDLSPERRERLAELARDRNFFVLEDGVYSDVRFDGTTPPPLRELAPGHVIYCDSMSKTVGGGLRIGWIAARGPVFDRLAMLKLNTDFHSNTLSQHITARFLEQGGYERHLEASNPFYTERRDLLMEALERHLPGEYRAEVPNGGHHVWMQLLRPIDERGLYREAVRAGRARSRRARSSPPSARRSRRCACRSRWSTRRSSTRASAGWRARFARCAGASASRRRCRFPSARLARP